MTQRRNNINTKNYLRLPRASATLRLIRVQKNYSCP